MTNEKTAVLRDPDSIRVIDEKGNSSYGCDQDWYGSFWQRMAGCGPSVASNLLLYLHHAGKLNLPLDVESKSGCVRLMEAVWRHVTPTTRGLYLITQFCEGVHSFTHTFGTSLLCMSLEIPKKREERPTLSEAADFIEEGLNTDCPVAFLNLSNGKIKALDEWHWVTIVSLTRSADGSKAEALVYDQDKSFVVDMKLWMETTSMGGGLVYFK